MGAPTDWLAGSGCSARRDLPVLAQLIVVSNGVVEVGSVIVGHIGTILVEVALQDSFVSSIDQELNKMQD